jgi:hypothetical protein
LWETLSEVCYTTPPLYEVVSFWNQGVPYARTTATVLPHPEHPEWADLSMMFFAHRGVMSVESAAMRILHTFCEQHPDEVMLTTLGLFPAMDPLDPAWRERISLTDVLLTTDPLKQDSDTVYEYAKKFNALCQYGGHHVDNNAKKIERFRDGLHGDLYERLNLYEPNSYQDLVNKAISQEDAMSKPRRIERGRLDSPLLVDQARNFALSRKVLRVLPSHLQLDTGG